MRLNVLGAGPAYTDRLDAAGAAYLVTHEGTHLLLDLGQGAFPRIFAHVHPTDLDAVVVTHLHPDHFIDLVPLRHYLRYEFEPPRRARVIGPRDLGARLDALHGETGFSDAALDLEVLRTEPCRIGSLTLEGRLVTHTKESYAVRVATADGPGIVYSGDCGRAVDLAPLIRPGDTLLTEVAFGPGPVPAGVLHLDGPAVGALAALADPGRVLLTHVLAGRDLDATLASVRARWDGPVEFVWPGTELDL
ncbi:MAG: MBL fold metallo-hydrolase [Candidatus Limnocylindrales bacterium]